MTKYTGLDGVFKIRVFESLPFYDRLRVELVNRRWLGLAKERSWCSFTRFSRQEFAIGELTVVGEKETPSTLVGLLH